MTLNLIGNDCRFDVVALCPLFFPRDGFSEENGKILTVTKTGDTFEAVFETGGKVYRGVCRTVPTVFDAERCAVKRAVYDALSAATGITSPWGILTGVRPIHFYEKIEGLYGEKTEEIMARDYLVSPEKTALCRTVLRQQKRAREENLPGTAGLYLSIPFCPSRCKYCSFVSQVTQNEGGMIPAYVELLKEEIKAKTALAAQNGDRITTVYIGGGTPTTLSAEQISDLLNTVNECVDVPSLSEFTVEAGRPDTITPEKLAALEAGGVTRISVNPQTLNDEVLRTVGRRHTAADFFRAYEQAARTKMDINVDLIAGLPGDTPESFEHTVRQIVALDPANITVHTLYLKRAADYGAQDAGLFTNNADAARIMVDTSRELCDRHGYLPYYLYRQKNTVGNLENVGYAKNGKESRYNIYMMDDLQTVYGAGANAITKILTDGTVRRTANTKYAVDYLREKWK